jgi:hypothetical protein
MPPPTITPTPQAVAPANGAVVATSQPTFTCNLVTVEYPNFSYTTVDWEVSTSPIFAGFATHRTYLTGTTGGPVSTPSSNWATLGRLAQGVTYYLRCIARSNLSPESVYSSTTSFTVSHPPGIPSFRGPSSGESVEFSSTVPLRFRFNDTFINAALGLTGTYEIEFSAVLSGGETQPAGMPIVATGALVLDGASTVVDINTNVAWKDRLLRWRVRTSDEDGVMGAWSPGALFTLRDPGTVTVTSPTDDQVIETPTPTADWTFAASASRTQSAFYMVINERNTPFTEVYNSGWIESAANSWTPNYPALQPDVEYELILSIRDSTGIVASASRDFETAFTTPESPIFSVDTGLFADYAALVVDWTGVVEGSNFTEWRVYRRNLGEIEWTLLGTFGADDHSYIDYLAPSQLSLEYSVVQVATTFGVVIESSYQPQIITASCDKYFIICPSQPELNVAVTNTVSDDFDEEYEQATLSLIGRGRRHEVGTRFGYVGSMSAQLYDDDLGSARAKRQYLHYLRAAGLPIYLRNPFGDVWPIAITGLRFSRMAGVGEQEFGTIQIDYTEVVE